MIWIAFWASNTDYFPEKVRVKWTSPTTPGNYTKPSDALKINTDSTQFHELTSIILLLVPDRVQNKNQIFYKTATKAILPSTTYGKSAVDIFALCTLLNNFSNWKIVLRNLVGRKALHKEISTCLESCECRSELFGMNKPTNPLKMHFIINSFKVHLNAFLILCPG